MPGCGTNLSTLERKEPKFTTKKSDSLLKTNLPLAGGAWGTKLEARLREQVQVDDGESDAGVQDKVALLK